MILITGGLGFIGLHTARALLDLGQSCVLIQHRTARQPDFIKSEIGQRVFIEEADIADQNSLLSIGERHKITGIIHLAGPGLGSLGLFENLQVSLQGLLNVLYAANAWGVSRVSIASTIGVYLGITEPIFREDMPLPMSAVQPIQTVKKSSELIAAFVGSQAGFEVVNLRIGGIWGPLGRPQSGFFIAPQTIHAAVKGETLNFAIPAYAEDGIDMCYVKDCGRAIALLQQAQKLNHTTYNIGSGRATTNQEVVDTVKQLMPTAQIGELVEGYNPHGFGQAIHLDITRLQEDTGYQPAYNLEQAVADYVNWLGAGNER